MFNNKVDEDKLIEERRKRRRAILEKYKSNVDSPASLSGSTKVSNDTDDNDTNNGNFFFCFLSYFLTIIYIINYL